MTKFLIFLLLAFCARTAYTSPIADPFECCHSNESNTNNSSKHNEKIKSICSSVDCGKIKNVAAEIMMPDDMSGLPQTDKEVAPTHIPAHNLTLISFGFGAMIGMLTVLMIASGVLYVIRYTSICYTDHQKAVLRLRRRGAVVSVPASLGRGEPNIRIAIDPNGFPTILYTFARSSIFSAPSTCNIFSLFGSPPDYEDINHFSPSAETTSTPLENGGRRLPTYDECVQV